MTTKRVSMLMKVGLNPYAECVLDDCDWTRQPSSAAAATIQAAKDHAKLTGHQVMVIHETRALYGQQGGN